MEMEIRKANQKLKMNPPEKTPEQVLEEKLDKLDKKIDKLFKVLDLRFTKS